ncbi:MAG: hypothetical protein J6Y94_04745 [Bacteriovoracaceae bacterium]|nr:hypothetical protein [Bacteriovoracaceae bacterium]
MKTDFETLLALASYTLNYLKEAGFVDFDVEKRAELIEALATELGVSFATDEDIKEQAIEEVEEKLGEENMPEDITESEIFNHARKEIIKTFNGESIGGLYLVESLHDVAIRVNNFLLNCPLVNDVYGTDEEISNLLISKIRNFSVKRA